MQYSNIISDFTWSYSRIKQFESCPYAFLLHYIKHMPKKTLFFSSYGSFIHKLLERYLTGDLKKDELASEYLFLFKTKVRGKAPTPEIFKSYFEQGLNYLRGINFPYKNILAVEDKMNFDVEGNKFVGVVDCVAQDGDELVIVDHKSRALKERSQRKKPTKTDEELDSYLKQLYLYSFPVREKYGRFPDRLEFNCFRTGKIISEKFRESEVEKAKSWAVDSIKTITDNDDWSPKVDFWKCCHLCDFSPVCEYYQMCK